MASEVAQGDQLNDEVALRWLQQRQLCARHLDCPGRPIGFGGSDVRV